MESVLGGGDMTNIAFYNLEKHLSSIMNQYDIFIVWLDQDSPNLR